MLPLAEAEDVLRRLEQLIIHTGKDEIAKKEDITCLHLVSWHFTDAQPHRLIATVKCSTHPNGRGFVFDVWVCCDLGKMEVWAL